MLDNLPGQDLNRRMVLLHGGRLCSFFFAPLGDPGSETRTQAESLYQHVVASFRFIPELPAPNRAAHRSRINEKPGFFLKSLASLRRCVNEPELRIRCSNSLWYAHSRFRGISTFRCRLVRPCRAHRRMCAPRNY